MFFVGPLPDVVLEVVVFLLEEGLVDGGSSLVLVYYRLETLVFPLQQEDLLRVAVT